MRVVRPEWLVDSANAGVLLPWRDFVYTPTDSLRPEVSQGTKTTQKSLSFVPPPRHQKPSAPDMDLQGDIEIDRFSPSAAGDEGPGEMDLPKYAAETSNANAQRAMANPEWRNAHTSVAPDFIEGYFKNSRLHHLSMWKAELRDLVQEAQARVEEENNADGKVDAEADDPGYHIAGATSGVSMRGAEFIMKSPAGKGKGKAKAEDTDELVIMHCDFDCFFVSAGLVDRQHLKEKPVVVCHSQGAQGGASSTSEIASASYEARAKGIKNGMRWVDR